MLSRKRRAPDRRYEHEEPITYQGQDFYFYEKRRLVPRDGARPDQLGNFESADLVEAWAEVVDIVTPGDSRSKPHYELDEEKRRRWAIPYGRFLDFKKGVPIVDGLLLEDWIENGVPVIPLSVVDGYYAQKIFTRRQLASITDGNLAGIGIEGTRVRREKAIKAEEAEKRNAPLAEIKSQNMELQRQLTEMQRQLTEMRALAVQNEHPAKPGRARRNGAETELLAD
jgi:hypothetical protein